MFIHKTSVFAALLTCSFVAATSARAETVERVAGTGAQGFVDGPALSAELAAPRGNEVGADGTIYFADQVNVRIRKISPAGIVSTVAGTGFNGDTGDGDLAINGRFGTLFSIA